MALALEIRRMAMRRRPACVRVDEVDAHRAYDLAVADEHVRKMAGLEFVRVVLVIGLARQQSGEDRVPANGVIGLPLAR